MSPNSFAEQFADVVIRTTATQAASAFVKRRERTAAKNATFTSHMRERRAGASAAPRAIEPSTPQCIETSLPEPDPRLARTAEEFVSKMRQLKAYTGMTLRGAEGRAGHHGELPKSTLSDALRKKSLPKPLLLRHFLQACGLTDDQIAVWESARRRIAVEEVS